MRIEDIAEIAGVSKSAVSIALNNKEGISDDTKKKILDIANEYNYEPLRKKKEEKIDLYFIACTNDNLFTNDYNKQPFFNELMNSLSDAATKYRYNLLIKNINSNKLNDTIVTIKRFNPKSAIILLGTNLDKIVIQNIRNLYNRIVILDIEYPTMKSNFISINNLQGSYEAAEYLISLGHKEFGYIKGSQRIKNFEIRMNGFKQCLNEHNLMLDNKYIFETDGTRIYYDHELEQKILSTKTLPTCFFCENDYMAISLIKVLKRNGILVPDDISVIGFDNINEGTVLTPELTTICVNKKEIIDTTLSFLSQKSIKGSKHILVNTSLVIRDSCKTIT